MGTTETVMSKHPVELYLTTAGHAIEASQLHNLGMHTCKFDYEDEEVSGFLNRARPVGDRMFRLSVYLPYERKEKYYNVHEDTQVRFTL